MIGMILLSILTQIGGSGGAGTQGGGQTIPTYRDHGIDRNCNYASAVYAPIPDCDTQLEASCVSDAYITFYQDVREAQSLASQKCQWALNLYDNEISNANNTFINCMNNLSWPYQTKRTCALEHEGKYMTAKTNYNIRKQEIMNNLNSQINSAKQKFQDRIGSCCLVGGGQ